MSKHKIQACLGECGRTRSQGWELNRKGYCFLCAMMRASDSMRQMHAKSGPFYDQWQRRMAAWAATLYPPSPGGHPGEYQPSSEDRATSQV